MNIVFLYFFFLLRFTSNILLIIFFVYHLTKKTIFTYNGLSNNETLKKLKTSKGKKKKKN